MIDLKGYVATLNQKPVAVYGLGLSGMATVRALAAAGAKVHAWDDNPEKRAEAEKVGAVLDDMAAMQDFAFLVLSPGIPLRFPEPHPMVVRAGQAQIDVIGDVELLHRSGHGLKTIGITGTNGKSTTTALIGHVLKESGVRAVVGGNIGRAVLDLDLNGKDVIVLELSSYQLDLCPTFSPDIAVHINLTPDHIDRHGSLQGYMDAKLRIFRGRGKAVIGIDDASSLVMMEKVRKDALRHVVPVSVTGQIESGVYSRNGILYDSTGVNALEIGSLTGLATLPGSHNHQNAAMAYTVCRLMNVRAETIMAAMGRYPGLPHRMFLTRVINGISYINDSKATNADAAGKALACYKNIYWIAGGRPKEGGLNELEPWMDRIAHAFLIGEAANDFSAWLKNHGVETTNSGTLDKAVMAAHRMAQGHRGQPGGGGVVLLSPACASQDQFRSFEHRGECFADLVMALPETQEVAAE